VAKSGVSTSLRRLFAFSQINERNGDITSTAPAIGIPLVLRVLTYDAWAPTTAGLGIEGTSAPFTVVFLSRKIHAAQLPGYLSQSGYLLASAKKVNHVGSFDRFAGPGRSGSLRANPRTRKH